MIHMQTLLARIVLSACALSVTWSAETPALSDADRVRIERLTSVFDGLTADRRRLEQENRVLKAQVAALSASGSEQAQDLKDAQEAFAIVAQLTMSSPYKQRLAELYDRAVLLTQSRKRIKDAKVPTSAP